ncbi:MAG: hypothetical protein BYD32DRAFT_424815 [Podila humilis]|nr:MAG: hypothetical protein BYD32DRAFT_424815 [Podila humilis]
MCLPIGWGMTTLFREASPMHREPVLHHSRMTTDNSCSLPLPLNLESLVGKKKYSLSRNHQTRAGQIQAGDGGMLRC